MVKKSELPKFGLLQGVQVLMCGVSVAGPFAASLMGEMGAEVIWVENPASPDPTRAGTNMVVEMEHRNQRSLGLNVPSPAGKEIFLRIIKDTDIFIENSKPGQWEKWGLTDEVLWEVNPKLVIAHVSGFGQTGLPEYNGRGSWDTVAQAFGGMIYANSRPGQRPTPALVSVADYYAAYMCAFSCLAGYIHAQRTGQGESIDVAQYEAVVRCGSPTIWDAINNKRPFNHSVNTGNAAGYTSYLCKDGNYVWMNTAGPSSVREALKLIGMGEYYGKEIPVNTPVLWLGTPMGDLFESRLEAFCANYTATELHNLLGETGISGSKILKWEQMAEEPQYVARKTLTRWKNIKGEEILACNVLPKLKRNMGYIWRPAPTTGLDNEDILDDLGYSKEEIAKFYEAKAIGKID